MKKLKQIFSFVPGLLLIVLFASWGYQGHKKVSENAPPSFPPSMSFLLGNFSTILVDSCLAPDNRKDWDDSESPKHYLDIDNYPEFELRGRIPSTYDSAVLYHGVSFVLDNGTVPWSTVVTFDSLRDCFARQNWDKAALFAADLGHYVGDAHNPMHITANYDGQYTGQDGIHYRYETKMLNAYHGSIVYPFDSAQYIEDVQGFVFSYIYANQVYVDSILQADLQATQVAGNTNSSAYTLALWERTKNFTIPLFHHASFALASLIYTAFVDSQHLGIGKIQSQGTTLNAVYPNPVTDFATISFDVGMGDAFVSVRINDAMGNTKATLAAEKFSKGHHEIRWDSRGFSKGFYYCILESGEVVSAKKIILVN
jgi:hypothetical protein